MPSSWVELKAVSALLPIHMVQLLSYLKAGSFQLGLPINFNVMTLGGKAFVV